MAPRPAIHFEVGFDTPREIVDELIAIARRRARRIDDEFGVPDSWAISIATCRGGFACTVRVDRPLRVLRVTTRNRRAAVAVRTALDGIALRLTCEAHGNASTLG